MCVVVERGGMTERTCVAVESEGTTARMCVVVGSEGRIGRMCVVVERGAGTARTCVVVESGGMTERMCVVPVVIEAESPVTEASWSGRWGEVYWLRPRCRALEKRLRARARLSKVFDGGRRR